MEPKNLDKRYKEYLKMKKRIAEIDALLNEIPLVPLDKPFIRGWVVSIKLRPDIARRKDAKEIMELISIGYQSEYITLSEKEVKVIRSGKKSYSYTQNKKRVTKYLVPQTKRINEKTFDALTEKQKAHFYLDTLDPGYLKYGRKIYMLSMPDFYICLRARPNWITHYRKKGGALESERDLLEKKRDEYWLLATGGHGKSFPRGKDRTKTRAAIRKVLKGEADDIAIEKIPLEYEY